MIDIDALKLDKRPQSSTVVHALLDRLEAAEKELAELRSSMKFRTSLIGRTEAERDALRVENAALVDDMNLLRNNNTALRAKIEATGRQEPVGKFIRHPSNGLWEQDGYGDNPDARPLYLAPGAQPALIEQDTSVRKAWARFSNELHRSPNAPYPGMSEAFEQHFSQSFTDREWRAESATWAAAWKAAKRHEAQAQPAPSAPSEEAAAEMGANGGHVVEAERLAFEAWMRGHCWKLGAKWTGTEYRSDFEKGGMVDTHAMRTRELWAAWRDRAALAAAPEAKP